MTDKLVSIITPLYNAERFIRETIESVLAQTYSNWEMIIINDGSTDQGPTIVTEYMVKEPRIQMLTQPNKGSAAARNNGIRQARGRYIALLDSDDLWEPWFLEQQLHLLHSHHCQLVYGAHKRINEKGEEILQPFIPPAKVTFKDMLKTCSISCLTGLYDTEPYGKVYLHEEFKSLRDDYVYWLEILRKCGQAYGNLSVIGSYRISPQSVSYRKIHVIRPQYRVYRDVVKLGVLRSLYYLICWAWAGFFKYMK